MENPDNSFASGIKKYGEPTGYHVGWIRTCGEIQRTFVWVGENFLESPKYLAVGEPIAM